MAAFPHTDLQFPDPNVHPLMNTGYPIVGIENSAPSLMPEGQRDVMVLVRV